MTGIEPHQPQSTPAIPAGKSLAEWAQTMSAAHTIAKALCNTSFAPAHFRGKPEEAAAAIMFGSEIGFSPTTSLQTLYVIGGKPALYARPMVALVQAAGHEVWTEAKTDDAVTVCGRRRGSNKVIRETWTGERAKRAGYTSNKKYATDPQAMLYARAASDVCRQVAADVLAGIGYSVEEMQLSDAPEPGEKRGLAAVLAKRATPAEPETPTEPEPPTETGELRTEAQSQKMHALFRANSLTREEALGYVNAVLEIGEYVTSTKVLTVEQASRVICALEAALEMEPVAAEPIQGESE